MVAVLLALAPLVVSLASTWRGWASEGDSAVIALRARDVLGADTPMVGMPTTLGAAAGRVAHHPGPLEFWALAPVERVWGTRRAPLVAVALVNAACIALSVLVLYRIAGAERVVLCGAFVGAALWPLRGEVLTEAFNPYAALLPLGLFLVAAVGLLRGVAWSLPLAVAGGSYAAQAHVSVAPVVIVVAAGVGVAATAHRGVVLRPALVALGLGLVLWAPVVVDQLFGSHNVTKLATAGVDRAAGGSERLGPRSAEAVVSNALGPVPMWMREAPRPAHLLARPTVAARVAAGLAIAACLALVVARRGKGVSAPALVGLLALAGGTVGTIVIPATFFNALAPHNYLWLWPTTALLSAALVVPGVSVVRSRLAGPLGGLVAIAVVVAVATAVVRAEPAVPVGELRRAVPVVAHDVVGELRERHVRRVVVELDDDITAYSMQASVVLELDRAGVDVVVDQRYAPAFGKHRARVAPFVLHVSVGEALPPATDGRETIAVARADRRDIDERRVARVRAEASIRRAGGVRIGDAFVPGDDAVSSLRTGQLTGLLRVGMVRWDGMRGAARRLLAAEDGRALSVRVELGRYQPLGSPIGQ